MSATFGRSGQKVGQKARLPVPIRIADEDAHLALKYVAALKDQRYLLSSDEFEDFVQHPKRRVTPGHVLGGHVLGALSRISEPMLDWMRRVGWLWLDRETDLIHITELGHAVLRHLEREEVEAAGPVEVLLDPQNPDLVRGGDPTNRPTPRSDARRSLLQA